MRHFEMRPPTLNNITKQKYAIKVNLGTIESSAQWRQSIIK